MIIKDEIHGFIEFSDLEKRIIDTTEFQRLHRIRQMAFTYLVYPGATHTRFEHSIGTTHLASVIANNLKIEKDAVSKIRLYALLHDIGHVAFSHDSEAVLKDYLGSHEEIGKKKILSGEISDIIKENFSPKEIIELENTEYGKIINSDLGADRMDYLIRDAHNTGVAYGVIDTDRIINKLRMEKKELIIEEGALEAAESLLIARFMMFSALYLHKTVRIAAAMLKRAIKLALEDKTVLPQDFLSLVDDEILLKLKQSKNAKEYVDRLLTRNLYKEAYSYTANSNNKLFDEKTLKQKYNFDIIVDYPSDFFKPVNFKVKTSKGVFPIYELSDIVQGLKKSEDKRKRVLFLCSREYVERLSNELQKEF